jgi:hypothetical protein
MNTFQKSGSLIKKQRERLSSVLSDETLNAPGTRSEASASKNLRFFKCVPVCLGGDKQKAIVVNELSYSQSITSTLHRFYTVAIGIEVFIVAGTNC